MNLDVEFFLDNEFNNFDQNLKFESLELLDLNRKIKQSVTLNIYAFCFIRNPMKLEVPTTIHSERKDINC